MNTHPIARGLAQWRHVYLDGLCNPDGPFASLPWAQSVDPPVQQRNAYRVMREVCVWCPVRADCFRMAVDECLDFGMYGGLTPKQRGHWMRDNPTPVRDALVRSRMFKVNEACERHEDGRLVSKKAS